MIKQFSVRFGYNCDTLKESNLELGEGQWPDHGCVPVFSVLLLLIDVVVQQLDDQVDVGQDHAPAAVPLATKLVKGLATQKTACALATIN